MVDEKDCASFTCSRRCIGRNDLGHCGFDVRAVGVGEILKTSCVRRVKAGSDEVARVRRHPERRGCGSRCGDESATREVCHSSSREVGESQLYALYPGCSTYGSTCAHRAADGASHRFESAERTSASITAMLPSE